MVRMFDDIIKSKRKKIDLSDLYRLHFIFQTETMKFIITKEQYYFEIAKWNKVIKDKHLYETIVHIDLEKSLTFVAVFIDLT